jgi:hypothetical protein
MASVDDFTCSFIPDYVLEGIAETKEVDVSAQRALYDALAATETLKTATKVGSRRLSAM